MPEEVAPFQELLEDFAMMAKEFKTISTRLEAVEARLVESQDEHQKLVARLESQNGQKIVEHNSTNMDGDLHEETLAVSMRQACATQIVEDFTKAEHKRFHSRLAELEQNFINLEM